MMRITDLMKNNQLVRNTTRHQMQFDEVQNQLATGQRIRRPADDPAAATNQMFFRTRVNELDQFDRNLTDARSRLDLIDGQLAGVTDIMQRVRVLSVQASNGIYQGDNHFELRQAIAKEIDQHLRQMVELANGRDSTGRALFGGHVVERLPFETVQGNVEGLQGLELENVITAVRYRGDIGKQLREVERDQYLDVNLPGNKVFWGTNMTVTGTVDNSAYQATADQVFKIDGVEIHVAAGDTIDDVIDKINNSNLEVKASKIGADNISLHTSSPHQIWLEDVGNGTVLKDIGLVNPVEGEPPNNYAESARVNGLSMFDMLIKLRNDLVAGDQLEIGGRDLANIDETINNLLRYRAEVGARQNRVEDHTRRVSWDKTYMQELLAKSEGIDYPETIINLKWLETVHQYSLNVGARIIRPQLMDFLR